MEFSLKDRLLFKDLSAAKEMDSAYLVTGGIVLTLGWIADFFIIKYHLSKPPGKQTLVDTLNCMAIASIGSGGLAHYLLRLVSGTTEDSGWVLGLAIGYFAFGMTQIYVWTIMLDTIVQVLHIFKPGLFSEGRFSDKQVALVMTSSMLVVNQILNLVHFADGYHPNAYYRLRQQDFPSSWSALNITRVVLTSISMAIIFIGRLVMLCSVGTDKLSSHLFSNPVILGFIINWSTVTGFFTFFSDNLAAMDMGIWFCTMIMPCSMILSRKPIRKFTAKTLNLSSNEVDAPETVQIVEGINPSVQDSFPTHHNPHHDVIIGHPDAVAIFHRSIDNEENS